MSGPHRWLVCFVWLLVSAPHALVAQGPSDPNEGSRVEWDNTNEIWRFSWWGRSGQTYFIQHSDDLASWTYVPIIEPGNNAIRQWGFTSDSDKFFVRLKHTGIPTNDPFLGDFDGDRINNYDELYHGTDPLSWGDTDSNLLPDDWEQFYFGQVGVNPAGNADGDGANNLLEFQRGTNPVQFDVNGGRGQVAAAVNHSLAVRPDGSLWSWGQNNYGQLGIGSVMDQWMPGLVEGISNVAAVAGGAFHSVAVKADGTVWAWGSNGDGAVGDGTTTNRAVPVAVSGLSGAVSAAAGRYHTVALKSDGTVWAWVTTGLGSSAMAQPLSDSRRCK